MDSCFYAPLDDDFFEQSTYSTYLYTTPYNMQAHDGTYNADSTDSTDVTNSIDRSNSSPFDWVPSLDTTPSQSPSVFESSRDPTPPERLESSSTIDPSTILGQSAYQYPPHSQSNAGPSTYYGSTYVSQPSPYANLSNLPSSTNPGSAPEATLVTYPIDGPEPTSDFPLHGSHSCTFEANEYQLGNSSYSPSINEEEEQENNVDNSHGTRKTRWRGRLQSTGPAPASQRRSTAQREEVPQGIKIHPRTAKAHAAMRRGREILRGRRVHDYFKAVCNPAGDVKLAHTKCLLCPQDRQAHTTLDRHVIGHRLSAARELVKNGFLSKYIDELMILHFVAAELMNPNSAWRGELQLDVEVERLVNDFPVWPENDDVPSGFTRATFPRLWSLVVAFSTRWVNEARCTVPGCDEVFSRPDARSRHIANKHSGV